MKRVQLKCPRCGLTGETRRRERHVCGRCARTDRVQSFMVPAEEPAATDAVLSAVGAAKVVKSAAYENPRGSISCGGVAAAYVEGPRGDCIFCDRPRSAHAVQEGVRQ